MQEQIQDPPYGDKVYNALRSKVSGFKLTQEEFKQKISDPEYQRNVYKALKEKVQGFDLSEENFNIKIAGVPLKKKEDTSPRSASIYGSVGSGLISPSDSIEVPMASKIEAISNFLGFRSPIEKSVFDFGRSLVSTVTDQTPKAIAQSGEVINAYMEPSSTEEFINKDKYVEFQRYVRERDPDFTGIFSLLTPFDQEKYIDKYGEKFMQERHSDDLKKIEERLPATIERRLKKEQYVQEQNKEAAEKMVGSTQSISDVKSVSDALSYIGTVTGQAAGQIPLSVATRGLSSVVMESATTYDQQIDELAGKHGISREEVVKQNLDRPAANQTFALLAAALDRASAGNVLSVLRSKAATGSIGQAVVNVVGEMVTEGAQGNLERYAAKNAADVDYEPLSADNILATVNEVIAGGLGGGLFSFAGGIAKRKTQNSITSAIVNENTEIVNNSEQQESIERRVSGQDTATDVQIETNTSEKELQQVQEETKTPEQVAGEAIDALVASGDVSREGKKVTILTERGGVEAKKIYAELERTRQSIPSPTEQPADNTTAEERSDVKTSENIPGVRGVSQETDKIDVQKNDEFTKREQPEDVNVGFVTPQGLGFKMPIDLIGKAAQKTSKWIRKNVTSSGLLPKTAFDIANKTEQEKSANLTRTKFYISDLEKAISKEFPKTAVKGRQLVNDVLTGNKPYSDLTTETAKATKQLRDHIYQLQKEMIDEGVVEGKLAARMDDQGNTYLNRSYKVHDTPEEWRDYLEENPEGQAIKNKATAHIRSQMPGATQDELDGVINELLYNPEAPLAILKGGKLGSKDLGVLKKRKDIDPVIRALMGEYSDPVVNYAKSVAKMNTLLAHHKLQKQIREDGIGKYLFEKPTKTHYAEIAPSTTKVMDGLTQGKSIYTTPEIKEAIDGWNEHTKVDGWFWKMLYSINAMTKYSKTVLSTSTHARNLIGSAILTLANGHLFDGWGQFKNAGQSVATKLLKLNNTELRNKIDEYVKAGIVGESHNAGFIKDVIKDANEDLASDSGTMHSSVMKYAKKGMDALNELYAAEDDLFKIIAYENEIDRYSKAYKDDLSAGTKTPEDIKTIAANIVRNTYPTYSLTPKIIKALRKNIFVSSFPTFTAEMIRTQYNAIKQIKTDLSDTRTRSIGIKRLAGLLSAISATYAMRELFMSLLGIGDEEDKAIESFVAPWSVYGHRIYTGRDLEKNTYSYIDLSFSDPFSYFKRPIDTILSGITDEDKSVTKSIGRAGLELAQPFIAEEMLFDRAVESLSNITDDGRQVYNPEGDLVDNISKISNHISSAFKPGTISSIQRLSGAIKGETSERGKELKVGDELSFMLLGQRLETLNVAQSFGFKMRDIKRRLENAENLYDSLKYRKGNKSQEDIENARKQSGEAVKSILDQARTIYQDAIKLGVKQPELFRALDDRGIDKRYLGYIMGYSDFIAPRY